MTLTPFEGRRYLGFIFSLPTVLAVVWLLVLQWGERSSFEWSLNACEWAWWERWPSGANPHHVVLIADPQLVDPHTYPGRPWPLSSLTVWYTDLYLRRSYRLLQEHLEPDTIFFLGDLFDGGREWATGSSSSPEQRYKKYGNKFWMKEYRRFVKLFLRGWGLGHSGPSSESRGRKIISSLPGNHDLGFAGGIQLAVKERFDAYFGPLNRVDIVGNHSFISLDTVSLSAMDQVDSITGSSGLGDGTSVSIANSVIWKPVDEFLQQSKTLRARAVQNEVLSLSGASDALYSQDGQSPFAGNVNPLEQNIPVERKQPSFPSSSFPTIVLSHVPFYRPPDTDCGPLREHGRALAIAKGYQYQNVLTPLISKQIISRLNAAEVAQIYSGDDHDYCEVDHLEFTGRIKEITVKSMSWAMGVRKPGFLAVSLYNPVDLDANAAEMADAGTPKDTIQNHSCLLPDQLTIFIRYAQLLGVTFVTLFTRVLLYKPGHDLAHSQSASTPLLPLSENKSHNDEHAPQFGSVRTSATSASSTYSDKSHLSTRSNGRSSSPSKLGGYGNLPIASRSSSPVKHNPFLPHSPDDTLSEDWSTGRHNVRRKGSLGKFQELKRSVLHVAVPVLLRYLWLVWTG